jgi:DNA-binding transcriptional MerR regulator
MKEPYYTIREAALKVGVESHVLRYWEEELKMDIHRNQMGHRYYTEHDIELLCKVRTLKDKGIQLKAIRNYIEKRQEQMLASGQSKEAAKEHEEVAVDENEDSKAELVPVKPVGGIMSNAEKLEQFQRIMNKILSNAIIENNELIGRSAGEHAATAVTEKLTGMTKEQEERAEARYRKLDQTLREIQQARKEAAAANMRPVDKRRQQRLKKKNKAKEGQAANDRSNDQDNTISDKLEDKTMETTAE